MSDTPDAGTAHEPVVHLQQDDVELARHDPDALHVDGGGMVNDWSAGYISSDGLLEVGYQDFSGSMKLAPSDGREVVTVILRGAGEIICNGRTISFQAGDIMINDCPVPEEEIRSQDGFLAVYVTRFRSREIQAAARPHVAR